MMLVGSVLENVEYFIDFGSKMDKDFLKNELDM